MHLINKRMCLFVCLSDTLVYVCESAVVEMTGGKQMHPNGILYLHTTTSESKKKKREKEGNA